MQVLDAALTQVFSSATDEEEAAYAVLRACGQMEGWALGTYWRLERGDGVLLPLTLWMVDGGLGGFAHVTLQSTFAPPEGLPGQAWVRREPLWSPDVTQDVRFLRADVAARHGLHGGLFLPVLGSGQVYGVLELLSRGPREDREADEALASALGYHFGRFLDRLRHTELEYTRLDGLRSLWDSDLLGLFISDVHGRILEANPSLLRMLGYSRQDVREERLTWSMLTPPRERILTEGALRQLRADGTFHSHEGTLLRKNDSSVPVLLGSAGLGEGRVVTFALDLLDWKPAEATAPQEADARLHTLIAHAPVVLFALDRDGLLTLSEGQGLEGLGLKPGQVVGMSVFDLYRNEPALLAHTRRALSGEEFLSVAPLSNGLHVRDTLGAAARPRGAAGGHDGAGGGRHPARARDALEGPALLAGGGGAGGGGAGGALARRVPERRLARAEDAAHLAEPAAPHAAEAGARGHPARGRRARAPRLEKAQRQLHKLARMMDELLDVSRLAAGAAAAGAGRRGPGAGGARGARALPGGGAAHALEPGAARRTGRWWAGGTGRSWSRW